MERKAISIGDPVTFVDEHGMERPALVTAIWGNEVFDDDPPSLNLVIVEKDQGATDQYGRQIRRETSVVHQKRQAAGGFYWR